VGISNWNAGIIRPVPVDPTGPYEYDSAPGVWTRDQVAYWQKQGLWPTAGNLPPYYIEELFSTYLYTGNGATQTITNAINLSGKGGLVWIKNRNVARDNYLFDTIRGAENYLISNTTGIQAPASNSLTAFNSSGFAVSSLAGVNQSGSFMSSWTFREQPKFFDVVTWTGNGLSSQTIPHSLGSDPGFIINKDTTNAVNWWVYHRSTGTGNYLVLNTTAAQVSGTVVSATSSTDFTVGSTLTSAGATYVAYLFAHNAGGFGLTGTDNVISCGSYTGNGLAAGPTVTLGYEPQWILIKNATGSAANWTIFDNMRGLALNTTNSVLYSNLNSAEVADTLLNINSTGFQTNATGASINANGVTYIYLAIRRGPMKVPTLGTTVFAPITYTGTNVDNRLVNTGIVTDMTMARIRTASSAGAFYVADRLRGNGSLATANTTAENTDPDSFMTPTLGYGNPFSAMNGFGVGNDTIRQLNQASTSQLAYAFKRAPGFFDEVCYKGAGGATSTNTKTHNLGVAPELIIIRSRNTTNNWPVWCAYMDGTYNNVNTKYLEFNTAIASAASNYWSYPPGLPQMTSTLFSVGGTYVEVNDPSFTYVAYLFATVAGVSKVGSYTGTAALQTINCGFSSGARFVLIKRTNAAGSSWWVYDSARGMSSGNDPYLLINDTTAENTGTNYVDTDTTGFKVTATAPADLNAVGGNYIFLAIA